MPDREKVLKALEHHKETAVCNGCPYARDADTPEGYCPIYDDAIALLKYTGNRYEEVAGMPDREAVIRGLTVCTDSTPVEECQKCPYQGNDYCTDAVMLDALALLQEQETVKPDFWISVEECLPKDSVEVFVLLKVKDVLVPDMGALISGKWWSTISCNMMVGDPLFWADIPHCPDGYKWYMDVEVNGDD